MCQLSTQAAVTERFTSKAADDQALRGRVSADRLGCGLMGYTRHSADKSTN